MTTIKGHATQNKAKPNVASRLCGNCNVPRLLTGGELGVLTLEGFSTSALDSGETCLICSPEVTTVEICCVSLVIVDSMLLVITVLSRVSGNASVECLSRDTLAGKLAAVELGHAVIGMLESRTTLLLRVGELVRHD